jgi:hypothetical protein
MKNVLIDSGMSCNIGDKYTLEELVKKKVLNVIQKKKIGNYIHIWINEAT